MLAAPDRELPRPQAAISVPKDRNRQCLPDDIADTAVPKQAQGDMHYQTLTWA
jgi:hypothetical protein